MRALLDGNVLIALLDRDHVHHDSGNQWLEKNSKFGWSSCPLTQSGCIRIMSNASYPSRLAIVDVVERLAEVAENRPTNFGPTTSASWNQRRLHGRTYWDRGN